MKRISRDDVAGHADRVHDRPTNRRGSRVRDSRGTTAQSKPRSRESESIAPRGRAETPSGGRSQSHGAGTAESPSRPRDRECRGRHAPVRIAHQARASESCRHCSRIFAGSLGNDDTSTCWSSRFSNRISARSRIAVGSAARFRSSCACAVFSTVPVSDADAQAFSHGRP